MLGAQSNHMCLRSGSKEWSEQGNLKLLNLQMSSRTSLPMLGLDGIAMVSVNDGGSDTDVSVRLGRLRARQQ